MTTRSRSCGTPPVPTVAEQRARRILASAEQSGLTRRELAERLGVSAGTLSWWKHEIARRTRVREMAAQREPAAMLVPVHVVGPSAGHGPTIDRAPDGARRGASACSYEVVLCRGRVVRVPSDFDAASLQALMQLLESPSC